MSRPERKASRILLKYGIVGDYDGAYDWIDASKYTDPDYSVGEHKGTWPSDGYVVIEVIDVEYIDNLEMWFDAELNAAKNDYERYKRLETENERLKDIYKGPHHSAIDATVCSDLVLREAERTYRVIDATHDALADTQESG